MNPFNQSTLLKPGNSAPDFELLNQYNQPVKLSDILKTSWVVLFFYPKDHSPICTTQVCAFRNAHSEFEALGASVIGISTDDIESHSRFAQHHQLPFTLLSDQQDEVRKAYGVPKTMGMIPGRVTFVIDRSQTIRLAYPSQFNAKAHMDKALALLQKEAKVQVSE